MASACSFSFGVKPQESAMRSAFACPAFSRSLELVKGMTPAPVLMTALAFRAYAVPGLTRCRALRSG